MKKLVYTFHELPEFLLYFEEIKKHPHALKYALGENNWKFVVLESEIIFFFLFTYLCSDDKEERINGNSHQSGLERYRKENPEVKGYWDTFGGGQINISGGTNERPLLITLVGESRELGKPKKDLVNKLIQQLGDSPVKLTTPITVRFFQ